MKKYFVQEISYDRECDCNEDAFVPKKKNNVFLSTPKFEFLDVKNYSGPGISYDALCKPMGCRLQKLMFPYEWLDSYEKLSRVGPVGHEDFYSSLKPTILKDAYEQFLKMFKINNCTIV